MTLVAVPNLQYVSDEEPGIRRRRAGRGFMYLDRGGHPIRDDAVRQRIRALAIPPAWTDVWIAPDPDGHIQATGRDARGRKQYRYHNDWREFRDRLKFEHLLEFGAVLPAIRRRVDRDMARPDVSRDRVVATVVRLLELSLIRVGNEEYARDNDSYGLTTLRNRHARVNGTRLEFAFRGKSGKEHRTEVADRRVARAVKRLQELPGQHLFQCVGEDGALCPVGSSDVNEYLREVSGADVTAKEYRTWMGSVLAAGGLAALPPPQTQTEARQGLKDVIGAVSIELGNTPAVCRASYVHPTVIEEYEAGTLQDRWSMVPARSSRYLVVDERRLLALLRPRRRRRSARSENTRTRAA
jgi:DNA topoisomerase I